MGLFSSLKKQQEERAELVSVADHTSMTRDYAIEYIVSLDKAAKDKFIEAVDLIWQGYDKLDRVKTRDEKALEREIKAIPVDSSLANDPDFGSLETEPAEAKPTKNDI
jgi:hypothetical protein